MTDKELRKLSRLELLELLLEASRENEKLKEKIAKMKQESNAAKSIENLSATTKQVSTVLEYANNLTDTLRKTTHEVVTAGTKTQSERSSVQKAPEEKQPVISDRNLYWRIMNVYAKNDEALDVLPDDIRNDIRDRIRGILESRKNS